MAENSAISWTDHSFNPWWGCTKVDGSPACDHCYAESFARFTGYGAKPKNGAKFAIWGADAQRRFFNDEHWNEPLQWNLATRAANIQKLVFCASMADWAEGRPDQAPHLRRLWRLQEDTEWLIWLMLTKRLQLISKLAPGRSDPGHLRRWHGTTAETQKWLDLRWSHLREVDSPVHWLSMEPLLEHVVLPADFLALSARAWVIVGGESGHGARAMQPDWARYVRDQCKEAGVTFHFKQWGSHDENLIPAKGKAAGHLLDGIEWRERPDVSAILDGPAGNVRQREGSRICHAACRDSCDG